MDSNGWTTYKNNINKETDVPWKFTSQVVHRWLRNVEGGIQGYFRFILKPDLKIHFIWSVNLTSACSRQARDMVTVPELCYYFYLIPMLSPLLVLILNGMVAIHMLSPLLVLNNEMVFICMLPPPLVLNIGMVSIHMLPPLLVISIGMVSIHMLPPLLVISIGMDFFACFHPS